jgi:hypothetical protein
MAIDQVPTKQPCPCGTSGCVNANNDLCVEHYRHEPADEKTYRVCGECWHAFQTEEELIDEFNKVLPSEVRSVNSGTQVFACPHCAHDF